MEQRILSKNNKQKTETEHGLEEQTRGSWGERGGSGMDGHFGGFCDINSYIFE